MQHAKAALTENDGRCITRDVGRRHHRNAHVGRMERRRVIDAVAHVSHHVASTLQRENDSVLLGRRDPREDGRLLRQLTEGRVVGPGDVVAGDDPLIVERNLGRT